ncbi:MAG: carbohydrate ABC transporter substrate-binding protein, partial [Lachnospiraceae bacterium]|nr:carbohydrate ABC transporter substrate-binding protein [Lachnospiraceae bacterium]
DTKNMYQYTKDIVTDSQGNLKGVSWQACPAIMFYNRDIATEVLGTDDPDEVQEYVKDWETFGKTAETMAAKGYKMTSSVNDTFRIYSNNVSSKWVEGGKLTIDDNIMNWVDDSKDLVDKGETAGTAEILSDDWAKGMYEDQAVFCTFGPAWMINFCMHADEEGSVANAGKWGGCVGPQSFYWGGTWLCAAAGTDNAELVKDIMYKFSCDEATLKALVEDDDQFANNKPVMNEMAKSDYTSKIMGGQNPLPMYCAGAEKVDLSNLSPYDQGCNEEFQNAMKNYFDGNATKEEALELFYKAISEKYPSIELPQ